MEKKENEQTADIFWSREPIMGHRGTKENPAIVPSYNTSRCVGLETEQVRWPPPRTPSRRGAFARATVDEARTQHSRRCRPGLTAER